MRSDDDKFVSGVVAHYFFIFWLLGVVAIAVARLLFHAWHTRRKDTRDPTSGAPEQQRFGRAGAAVRTVLPFLAALLLAGLVIGPPVWDWATRPSDIESAVETDRWGEEQGRVLGVSCEETKVRVHDAQIHVCEVRHCDRQSANWFECPETTSIACAALADGRLMMVSAMWSAGRESLNDELESNGYGRCPA